MTAQSKRTGSQAVEPLTDTWLQLLQIGSLGRRLLEQWLAPLGTSPDQVAALLAIDERNGATVGQIARDLGIERNSASQLGDRLVGAGLISRERETGDRRRVRLHLTPRGADRLGRSEPALRDFTRRLAGDADGEARLSAALDELLRRVQTISQTG